MVSSPPAAHEILYFGAEPAGTEPTWATFTLPTGQQAVDVRNSGTIFQTLTTAEPTGIPWAANGGYFYILAPDDRDPVRIEALGSNQLSGFTMRSGVRTIGSTSYNVYFDTNNTRYDGRALFTVTTE